MLLYTCKPIGRYFQISNKDSNNFHHYINICRCLGLFTLANNTLCLLCSRSHAKHFVILTGSFLTKTLWSSTIISTLQMNHLGSQRHVDIQNHAARKLWDQGLNPESLGPNHYASSFSFHSKLMMPVFSFTSIDRGNHQS